MKLNKIIILAALILLTVQLCSGCGKGNNSVNSDNNSANSNSEYAIIIDSDSDIPETSSTSSQSLSDKKILYVTGTDKADIFSTPDSNGSKIAELKYGTEVELPDDMSDSFTHIISVSDGADGYIRTEYLTDNSSAVTHGESIYVTVSGKYLYNDNNGANAIRGLDENESLILLAKNSGGYWRVKTMYNEIGYVTVDTICVSESETDIMQTDGDTTNSANVISSDSTVISSDNGLPNNMDDSTNSISSKSDHKDTSSTATTDPASVLTTSVENAQYNAGGQWQAALIVPGSGTAEYTSDEPKQAASLIKLFIMGAIYEKYDMYIEQEPELDYYLHSMITVSDNSAANHLVGILGSGNTDAGKNVVTAYCTSHGYYNTSMGRLLLESTENGDNYTSAYDCAKFLLAAYSGEMPHSADMISLLKQQERTSKIPAGVSVQTANKTGELDLVQNDAAIVYADTPYILCVLAENVDAGSGVSGIVNISSQIYSAIAD